MKVFVAGASGALGTPVVRALRGRHDVFGTTRNRARARALEALGARPVLVDAMEAASIRAAIEKADPEVVVDLLTALPKDGPMRPADMRPTNEIRTRASGNADSDRQRQVVAAFLEATASGDLPALLRTLDPAVMLLADGGGKAPAAGRPVHGPRKVAQVLLGGFRWYPGMTGRLIPVNGGAGVVVNYAGRVIALAGLIVAGDRITEIDLVVNPDKLRRFAAGA